MAGGSRRQGRGGRQVSAAAAQGGRRVCVDGTGAGVTGDMDGYEKEDGR